MVKGLKNEAIYQKTGSNSAFNKYMDKLLFRDRFFSLTKKNQKNLMSRFQTSYDTFFKGKMLADDNNKLDIINYIRLMGVNKCRLIDFNNLKDLSVYLIAHEDLFNRLKFKVMGNWEIKGRYYIKVIEIKPEVTNN